MSAKELTIKKDILIKARAKIESDVGEAQTQVKNLETFINQQVQAHARVAGQIELLEDLIKTEEEVAENVDTDDSK